MTDSSVSVTFTASIADLVSGIAQARDALSNFAGAFGDMNGQFASLASASSQAFNASRLQSYGEGLSAIAALERSYAAERSSAAAALRSGDDAAYSDAVRAAQLATSEEIRINADGLKQTLANYAEDARLHHISLQEKLAASRQALDEEYAGHVALLQRQAALDDGSLAAKQRADNQLLEAERRYNDQLMALTRTTLAEQQQQYESFANSVTQSFNSQLHGLLSGTTNWQTAFKNILEDLLIKFIEWGEELVVRQVATEAARTSATTSGVAARAGAEQAGVAASLGAQAAAAARSILTSAAEVFAGVFGFLAPFVGPFAAGPAATAQAAAASAIGSVASADIGMWSVPADMLTLVHHNELIMPAAEAGAFRSFLGDNDGQAGSRGSQVHIHPTTNFHVSAIDSGSVAQWMKGNSASMLKAMDEAVRHGAHLGLRRLGA